MQEIWKDIPQYVGLYQASNLGRIKRLKYYDECMKCWKEEYIKKGRLNNNGYMLIDLYKDNKQKTYTIHKLIALTFIKNPSNYPCINHKDTNKTNNAVSNLEWCSYSYNNTYGDIRERSWKTRKKKQSA